MTEVTRKALYIRGTSSRKPSIWLGSRSSQSIPEDAILTEDGIPIRTELDQYLLTET